MKTLENKIAESIKEAMKSKDKTRLDALRAVKTAIQLEKTKGGSKELSPADEIKILQKLVKQRKESAAIYRQQNRPDLAEVEETQLEIIQDFLPAQISDEELESVLKQIIEQTGASSMRDMGKVMGMATGKLAGKADGKRISEMVKRLLS